MADDTALPTIRNWTVEQLQVVRELWGRGETSAEIATHIPGKTRSAVIGVIHRCGFTRRPGAMVAGGTGRQAPNHRAPKMHVVSRGPGSRGGSSARRMTETKAHNRDPAPITLGGPAWSLPAGTRAASNA